MREEQRNSALRESGTTFDPRIGVDVAAFSGGIAACVAGTIALAVSLALEVPVVSASIGLAISGTLVVYNVDRLRDLERDRITAPLRSAFIARHRGGLRTLVGLAGLTSAAFAWRLGPATWALCAGVLAIGLMHRRLKLIRSIKSLYVSAAWSAIVVGLPVLGGAAGIRGVTVPERVFDSGVVWSLAIVGSAFMANLVTSNSRASPPENGASRAERLDSRAQRSRAQGSRFPGLALSLFGIVFAYLSPEQFRGLGLICAMEFAAISKFRPGERYALVIVDGALAVGGLAAIAFALA